MQAFFNPQSESPGDAKSKVDQTVVRPLPFAPCSAEGVGSIAEACTAYDAKAAVSIQPRRSIARITRVLLVPATLRPLPHVAVHVVEAPWVGKKTVHRNG